MNYLISNFTHMENHTLGVTSNEDNNLEGGHIIITDNGVTAILCSDTRAKNQVRAIRLNPDDTVNRLHNEVEVIWIDLYHKD